MNLPIKSSTEKSAAGFVFTLDASFALLIIAITVIFIATQVFHPPTPNSIYLKQISMDTLTVLGKTDKLSKILGENSTEVRQVLDALPSSVCGEISLVDGSGTTTVVTRPGCGNYKKELQVTRIPYVDDGNYYIAEMRSWYG